MYTQTIGLGKWSCDIIIDAMHCVFLGVMSKTMVPYWFGVAHRSKPFNIRGKVQRDCIIGIIIYIPRKFSSS